MQLPASASHRRLVERIAPLTSIDPEDRDQVLKSTEDLVRNTPLISIEGEILRNILQIQEHYGSVVHAKVLSETPGESHYDYCFPSLLRFLERAGSIIPARTKCLIEPTSCNAGVSLAWSARLKGYDSEIIIPESLPLARASRVREEATIVTLASSECGFIKGVQQRLRRRMVELKREGIEYWCPNHSEIEATPRAFQVIGQEVNVQLPPGQQLDYFVAALGNGTTIKGISPVLQEQHPHMKTIGYEDADPSVTLIGAGGRQGVTMKFVEALRGSQLPVVSLHEQDWRALYEGYNTGKNRIDTIGCTSAAALAVARHIIQEQRRALKILVMFYDKADRYGDVVVTSDTSYYLGDGRWSEGVSLR